MSERSAVRDAVIKVRALHKVYRVGQWEIEVLKGVDLTVQRGEFIAVMGPSGAGKSTLLYLIGGLESPTSGTVMVNGHDVAAMDDRDASLLRRREVGFVFQFYNLIPHLNVEENLLLPALLDGKKPRDYRNALRAVMHAIDLTRRRHHTPRELSGGEQQRVAIGRALINGPDIILADEPTGNLNSAAASDVMELLARINRERGQTVVLVTHSTAAAAHAQRVVRLHYGTLE